MSAEHSASALVDAFVRPERRARIHPTLMRAASIDRSHRGVSAYLVGKNSLMVRRLIEVSAPRRNDRKPTAVRDE